MKLLLRSSYPLRRAWIISDSRMLSAIFECTAGEGLISYRFSRTAAMREAAINSTEFGLFASLLLLLLATSLLRFRNSSRQDWAFLPLPREEEAMKVGRD